MKTRAVRPNANAAKPPRIAASHTPDRKPDCSRGTVKRRTAHIPTSVGIAHRERDVMATFNAE
jgi:hypothetical protein